MTIVISLAIQGPLLPGTAAGTLTVILIAIRGRPAARAGRAVRAGRAARSGHAGREPAARGRGADSLHLVSEGRFDPGLGAGWYQPEYDAAGIGFDPAGQRMLRLADADHLHRQRRPDPRGPARPPRALRPVLPGRCRRRPPRPRRDHQRPLTVTHSSLAHKPNPSAPCPTRASSVTVASTSMNGRASRPTSAPVRQ